MELDLDGEAALQEAWTSEGHAATPHPDLPQRKADPNNKRYKRLALEKAIVDLDPLTIQRRRWAAFGRGSALRLSATSPQKRRVMIGDWNMHQSHLAAKNWPI